MRFPGLGSDYSVEVRVSRRRISRLVSSCVLVRGSEELNVEEAMMTTTRTGRASFALAAALVIFAVLEGNRLPI